MFRSVLTALSRVNSFAQTGTLSLAQYSNKNSGLSLLSNQLKFIPYSAAFSSLTSVSTSTRNTFQGLYNFSKDVLLKPEAVCPQQIRTLIKFDLTRGRRRCVKAVPARFFRLHWGIWIRTMAGRHKHLWKKSGSRRNRLKQHVFCNATQSRMLDKMVSKYYRTPKYYINDPYQPYHNREEFYITRKKPWRPEGVDYEV